MPARLVGSFEQTDDLVGEPMATRFTQTLIAAGALVLAGLATATPASAATSLTITGNGTDSVTFGWSSALNGDELVIYPNSSCSGAGTYFFGTTTTPTASVTVTVGGNDDAGTTVVAGNYYAIAEGTGGQDTACTSVGIGTGGGSSSGSSAGSAPAPVVQQFGKPSTGTCDEAQPEGLNIGGASGGGWGESYAMWMNNGTGGFVCTRTLNYSSALGHWIVN